MKKITTLLAASLLSFSSHAGFWTSNQLLAKLDSNNSTEIASAYGYIAGVYDLGEGIVHCAPPGLVLKQIIDMTRRELINRPETRHFSADIYVTDALARAWPCKKKGEKTL